MRLLELVRKESNVSLRKLLFVAGVAGLSNALVLATINAGATQVSRHQSTLIVAIAFVLAILVYSAGLQYFMRTAISEVETILDRVRIRLADKVRRFDLE